MCYPILLAVCLAAAPEGPKTTTAPVRPNQDPKNYVLNKFGFRDYIGPGLSDFEERLAEQRAKQGAAYMRRVNSDPNFFANTPNSRLARVRNEARRRAESRSRARSYAPVYFYSPRPFSTPAFQYQYRYYVPMRQPYWQFYGGW